MSPLTFTLEKRPALPVDLSPLIPERLHGKKIAEIKAIPLASGNQTREVGELFKITGRDPSHIVIHRSSAKLYRVGAEMTTGLIEIHGTVGDLLGQDMGGGSITVRGNTGQWMGSGMKGGVIQISGNTGDFLGAARPGDAEGMSNGTIIVTGQAGDRVGDGMRRGTIAIKGDAGHYCGSRMLAGTILVLGGVGTSPGLGMRRGTLVLASRPSHIAATFNSCGILKVEFLRLLFKQLSSMHNRLKFLKDFGPEAERFVGDMALGGKGELLVLTLT
jgi:formylmethanofuran dehydrogenase subunit C